MFETQALRPYISSSAPSFDSLPPETRNAIYTLIFDSPSPFFVKATQGPRRRFKLRERSEKSQYDAVGALQALELFSRTIRQEYLTIFLQWLDSIGPQCRGVLRDVYLAGFMWYKGSFPLTEQFHNFLRSCTGMRKHGIQIHGWHLREARGRSLNAHLEIHGRGPKNGQMSGFDVSAWAETIVRLPALQTFRLDLIYSMDNIKEACGEVTTYFYPNKKRGEMLAEDVESQLHEMIVELGTGSGAEVEVGYMGIDKRRYEDSPWWW
ncbi:hypothetical protein HBI37_147520 [Parastagonospora nodorum]|nr:hypothetical protein HBH46_076020 [Parastagonospora nodorum]KAH5991438.1 hypothetical protein HBI84_169190 [Parastagonospora nodorum]KAH6335510.1 hypothetical protein HBI37_147520 [Parastagonospora nodorum]KAH6349541.1 hypothetical protein HBI36_133550 [Parastagonospora nodorum]